MKIIKKYLIKFLLILLLVFLLMSSVYSVKAANPVKEWDLNVADNAKDGEEILVKVIATILDIVRTIGVAIAVIILMAVACKYIIASSGDRADIKKYAFNYIVGALILFGTSTIITIVKNFIVDSTGYMEA